MELMPIVSLDSAKMYLRVDSADEDALSVSSFYPQSGWSWTWRESVTPNGGRFKR
jgi:hypothetical protein